MTGLDLTSPFMMAAQTTLAVSLMILLILLVRRPFAKHFGAGAAYALWALPALRLVMPPLPANLSLFGLFANTAKPVPVTEPAPVLIIAQRAPEGSAAPAPLTPSVEPVSIPPEVTTPVASLLPDINLTTALLAVWAIGAVAFMGVAIWRQARFNWLVGIESDPVDARTEHLADEIAKSLNLRRNVRIRSSLICAGPLVTGILRPTVVLPAWFATDYTELEQRQALTHELMHVKRGDLWSLPVAGFCLALQWFNPLAHLAMRAFRHDQEAACDSDVLVHTGASPRSYGETLVKTARIAAPAPHVTAAGLPLAHEIKERLIQMQNPAPTLRRRLTGTAVAVTAGVAAIAFTATAGEPPAAPERPTPLRATPTLALGAPPAPPEVLRPSEPVRVITIDGRRIDGNVVILSDPMQDWALRLERELEPRMKEIQARMPQFPMADLKDSILTIDLSDVDFPEGSGVSVEKLADGKIRLRLPEQSFDFDGQITLDLEDMAAFDAAIEALTAQIEANADTLEIVVDAVMEDFEANIESRAANFEIAMEDWAEEFEAFMEAEFEQSAEMAAADLEALVEGCEDTDGAVFISTIRTDEGKTYRALCLNDPDIALDDARVQSFMSARKDLTSDERKRYEAQLNELLGGR